MQFGTTIRACTVILRDRIDTIQLKVAERKCRKRPNDMTRQRLVSCRCKEKRVDSLRQSNDPYLRGHCTAAGHKRTVFTAAVRSPGCDVIDMEKTTKEDWFPLYIPYTSIHPPFLYIRPAQSKLYGHISISSYGAYFIFQTYALILFRPNVRYFP